MSSEYESFDKLEVCDDLSEPVRNPNDKKLAFCGERSSVTLYNQKRKRNSTTLQLLGTNTDVATENEVSVSTEQNVAQQLHSKHKTVSSGCIENTENKMKKLCGRIVEKSPNLLIMMMYDSTTFQEDWIK